MRILKAALIVSLWPAIGTAKNTKPIDYINPIIGASTSAEAGKSGHGLGKTFPGAATPFGLVQLSPDTRTDGDNGPGYSWHHSQIEGFSFTHMSGIGWYGDFGNLLITPTVGPLRPWKGSEAAPREGYRSRFSHDSEVARAGYYAVTLDDYKVRVELTSAPRAGMMRMTYPESDSSRIQIDLARRIGGTSTEQFARVVDANTIEGWMKCPAQGGGWGHGDGGVSYTVYFHCQMDRPMSDYGFWSADIPEGTDRRGGWAINSPEYQALLKAPQRITGIDSLRGKHIGFYSQFPTADGDKVMLRAGISFVSIEGARANLEHDINTWDFERTERANRALWAKAISDFSVEGATDREKIIFYTALYHTMIDPRSTSDVDGNYIGADGQTHCTDGDYTYRTIFSGWDVFRSQFPLQSIINPQLVNDQIRSLISIAERSGREYFPRWEIMNSYSGCMIGNPAVSVLSDAYIKGIRGYDIDKAYRYAVNSVEKFGNGELGYTPGSISHTLEYAYSDWCTAMLAHELGREADAAKYFLRSKNYKNIWNPADTVKWFAGRNADGSWGEWRGKLSHDLYCVESNPFQQGWFVPHDVHGLRDLMGGERFLSQLEEFFDKAPSDFLWNDYYNHPNEPVHQVPFMFAYTRKPYLTQKWTRAICERAYGTDVMGLCGNEDVGQLSAWYLLSAIGMHPVSPGDGIYILTSPVFSRISIKLDGEYYSGKQFTIHAPNNSPQNIYIQSIQLNGKPLDRLWIRHSEIVAGGTLKITMGPKPNTTLGLNNQPPTSAERATPR